MKDDGNSSSAGFCRSSTLLLVRKTLLISLLLQSKPSTSSLAMAASSRVARAAIAQLRSTRDKRSNLLNVARCAGWAKREGAEMLFLPECLGFMGDSAGHTLDQADPPIEELERRDRGMRPKTTPFRRALADAISSHAAGPVHGLHDDDVGGPPNDSVGEPFASIVDELRFIASESNLWISGGGVHTAAPRSETDAAESPAGPRIYNTHVIIDSHGDIKAHYHKIHLFDVSIPGKVNLRESNTTAPGRRLVVCDSPVGRLGLAICYDVRFPEMFVDLVQDMGAEVLLVPSAFTLPTGSAHWHALLKARAIEGQCYVLAAAQVGQHNKKRQSYGHSVVYDPWGELVADAGGYDGMGSSGTVDPQNSESPVRVPSIIIADIDLHKLAAVRERMPVQQHRDSSNFS